MFKITLKYAEIRKHLQVNEDIFEKCKCFKTYKVISMYLCKYVVHLCVFLSIKMHYEFIKVFLRYIGK